VDALLAGDVSPDVTPARHHAPPLTEDTVPLPHDAASLANAYLMVPHEQRYAAWRDAMALLMRHHLRGGRAPAGRAEGD